SLTAVVPADLLPGDITVRLGATWVPVDIYKQFVEDHLGIAGTKVALNKLSGNWTVEGREWGAQSTQTWGTERVPAPQLIEMAMNQTTPSVTDRDPSDPDGKRRIVNPTETVAANEKQEALKLEFVKW